MACSSCGQKYIRRSPMKKVTITQTPSMGSPGPKASRGIIRAPQPAQGNVVPTPSIEVIPATGQPKAWVTDGMEAESPKEDASEAGESDE